ncbi:Uncharacterised protein [Mycobacterium tuberculosis]|uniref:Uncharacterized protein n=1 Tax=Mycobacterium tuberculosis TaxID=1773 RepID=A0A916PGB3_MYCTX|nr:Uncharacterised protein [Mycobacterium tuberculosis]COW80700.1 Uncharacterised protein [Mycobacterium tuberculosis]COX63705.1 Uncharacterised protein [Mycobacterium tuberculosis]
MTAHRELVRNEADRRPQHQPKPEVHIDELVDIGAKTTGVQRQLPPKHHGGRFADPIFLRAVQYHLQDQRRPVVAVAQLAETGMDPAVPLLPLDVVALHPSGGESHSDTGILKTSAECLQGSGEQPIITMYELNKSAARDFQTFVVVSVEAEARLISQQAVSGSQHRCGDRGAVVGRVVVNDHDLELDALLFEDATQTALDGGAVVVHRDAHRDKRFRRVHRYHA